MQDTIRKHALLNAAEYGGKANIQSVMGKVLGEKPELKSDMPTLGRETARIVKEINSWPADKQKEELAKFGKIEKPEKVEREGLPDIPNAIKGKVITRMPPEPSKYTHIGHALSFLINYLYAKKYSGKCILRFDDTNPDKVNLEYVNAIKDDLFNYLDVNPNKIIFTSSFMKEMYQYAENLILEGIAYICTCDRDTMQDMRHRGTECEHRNRKVEESLAMWKKMLSGKFKEGEAVLRLKIDMSAMNQVMRDPVIFRISYSPHFKHKKKFCVWPLYDLQNCVGDELCGITHVLRSAEFGKMRIELQDYINNLLKFKKKTFVQYGRFEVEGKVTQGREIRKLIEDGIIKGWDDPRLVTLKALRKRGIVKDTYYKIAEKLGLNPNNAMMQWHMIASENRKLIDPVSNRYFFVSNPVEIDIGKPDVKAVKAPLIPEKKKKRSIPVTRKVFIEKTDFAANAGKEVRLMHFCNILVSPISKITGKELKDVPKIHWVPSKNVKIKLVTENNEIIEGLAEPSIKSVKPNQTVQFERIGFARCEKKGLFYFAHK